MVTTVNSARTDNTILDRPPLIVELVGPAGAGKTALLRTLCQRSESILVGARPRVQRIGYIPFFVRNAISLLPTLLRPYRNGRWFTRQEIVMLARLKGWHHVLVRQASRNGLVIVLDQGPVFLLSWLSEFGPESLKSPSSEKWRDSTIKQWAVTLDMVIWLDAPDTILMERIHTRGKWHLIKGESEQEGCKFLARFRTTCEQVISRLTASTNGPRVLRFDTAQESLNQIVDKVLAAFDLLEPNES